ncbi:ribosomal protein S6 kinase delta-1 isoform X2 [Dendroctonus ponderosae]|uniref:ribosomal protein S6 kinase delta-1 isoform X2 n=1 Tax=Dendroctonus ponderosae TaxID=77166 RepID=UPI002034C1D5|nr:ribosomal protein S6 kinase delta-1 isoform X2 [Dendroctonus ponderosae]KAH1006400.1 hypothetical protein HUJ05_007139 [Dendroctonus ponderosae]
MSLNPHKTPWMSWVRMFDIPEVSRHKDGFTIYRIISFFYPESCPDAVTKLIVWKRYNDLKSLHKEMRVLHKKLHIQDEFPALPKSGLFKRFDEETVNQRKRGILGFLEYIGTHSVLFTSTVFVKFFETSHAPSDLLNSNISAIRANLHLPEESFESDEDQNISDTDSFTSSNLGSTSQAIDQMSDSIAKSGASNLKKLNSMTSIDSQSSKTSETVSVSNMDGCLMLLDTSGQSDEFTQYLMNACMHINMAIELENERQYEEAFSAYKIAVDILISGGKDDPNYDRRRMVRYRTEKYLIRAEKIFNMHLAPEVKELNLQKGEPLAKPLVLKGPLYNLYKYKVIKIVSSSGMLALHCELQQLFFIKVIHKTVQFSRDLILPENVPYMVKLISHCSSDNAIYLILEYCSGTNLRDILEKKSPLDQEDQILRKIQDQSDDESEMSFSELLSAYASNRRAESNPEDFEIIDQLPPGNILDQPLEETGVSVQIDGGVSEASSLTEERIAKWAGQLLLALNKLHSLGVTCRDLQMDNLLIDQSDNLVLTYMCNVKELCQLYSSGINLDLAPEVYSFEEVTEAVDWWSFGAILYELLVGMPLSRVHARGLSSYTHLIIPKYVSIEGKSLLKQLLIFEPEERLGAKSNGVLHLKSHPFFRTVSWSTLERTSPS